MQDGRLFHLLDNLSILVIQATMERTSSDFGRCLKQRPKSEEARSIACLRALKFGEARASVPQWHRRRRLGRASLPKTIFLQILPKQEDGIGITKVGTPLSRIVS